MFLLLTQSSCKMASAAFSAHGLAAGRGHRISWSFEGPAAIGTRGYHTHYETLGVSRDATGRQIKDAYLKLSKELHPDKFLSNYETERTEEEMNVHARFVAINEAYTVLSRPDLRRIYDLGLPNPPGRVQQEQQRQERPKGRRGPLTPEEEEKYYRPMTFAERVAASGYPATNPYFYKRNRDHVFIAAGCVVLIVFGFLVHYAIAKMTFDKHQRVMVETTRKLEEDLEKIRQKGKNKTNSEIWTEILEKKKKKPKRDEG